MSAQETRLVYRSAAARCAAHTEIRPEVAAGWAASTTLRKADPAPQVKFYKPKAAYDDLMGQAQNYAQMRQANEALLQHAREAEQVRVNVAERAKADSEFEKFVTQADPQWQDASYRASLQKMAATLIEEIAPGSSDAIRRGQVFVTAAQQRGLYDIARARLGDERIKQSMRDRQAEGAGRFAESATAWSRTEQKRNQRS